MRCDYIDIKKEILLEAYEKCNRSLSKTAELLGVSAKTIKRRFKDHNLEYDKKVRYTCNENFFDELNEKSLYWLGFLATDGNVYKHNYSYTIKLALATKDVCMIEQFKKDIEFTGPIHSIINENDHLDPSMKQDFYYCSKMTITSKKIFNRLAEFNIVPNKTYILTLCDELKNHPDIRHFIRGCIDGDGWVREHSNNKSEEPNEIRVGFCGTKYFVTDIFNIIRNKLNIEGGTIYNKVIGQPSWQFEFSALHDVANIFDWLYKDATIFLPRKYDKFKKSKEFALRYTPFNITKEELQIELYKYKNITGIAKNLKVDPETIKTRMVKYNIDYKNKYNENYNYDYFVDESEGKYYWGGFLAGKSTYICNNEKTNLAFNSNNKSVIDMFIKCSNMNLNIIELKDKDYPSTYQMNLFDIIILAQLESFNINKDKQTNYFIPDWLLYNDNLHHFLRGYLDARSSLLLYNDKLSLNIKNSLKFLNQINDIFTDKCKVKLTPKPKDTGKNSFQIIYLRNQAKAILNYLYKDATIYLPRKYEIAKQVLLFSTKNS